MPEKRPSVLGISKEASRRQSTNTYGYFAALGGPCQCVCQREVPVFGFHPVAGWSVDTPLPVGSADGFSSWRQWCTMAARPLGRGSSAGHPVVHTGGTIRAKMITVVNVNYLKKQRSAKKYDSYRFAFSFSFFFFCSLSQLSLSFSLLNSISLLNSLSSQLFHKSNLSLSS